MNRRALVIGGTALVLTKRSALAQVDADGVNNESDRTHCDEFDANLGAPPAVGSTVVLPFEDGVVDRKGIHVEALPPTVVNGDDAVAHVIVKAANINASRFLWVSLAEKVGTDTYKIINNREYQWNSSGTKGLVAKDGTPVDCNTGGNSIYVTVITGMKKGSDQSNVVNQPRSDRSQEATLSVVSC